MSKIGRKPIDLGSVSVSINGDKISYKGPKASGIFTLDSILKAEIKDNKLYLTPKVVNFDTNRIWGLNRALLSNSINGANLGFEKQLKINGLGYKAISSGNKIQFSLGFSHKIDFVLPKDVSIEVDKTSQLITLRSFDKSLLGQVCSDIRALRPPEPYKGTGIQYLNESVRRKAGKAKS